MKLKEFSCKILVLMLVISCLCLSVAAVEVSSSEGTARAMAEFDMEVPANSAVRANSSFPLEVGEVVTIKATYSPFTASVDFGVIAPDGLFYGLNTTTGSFDKGIRVNQRGHYYLAVRNNSSVDISVSGYVNY